jgi:hypothetical protein
VSRRPRLLLAVPLLALGLAGCGAGVLGASTVEEGAADALEEQVGVRPEVSCPDDLAAEVGATTQCTLTAGDDPTEYPVTVTVTSIEGDSANFDVEVGDAPAG